MKLPYQHAFSVAAHRGDSYNCYENTMESFVSALDAGADMLETDVRLTADGKMVLMHDESALRTAGVDKTITEMTFDEVMTLNVGDDQNPQKVPTLEEFLSLVADKDVMLNVELKEYNIGNNKARCEKCIDMAVEMVRKYGVSERMVFNSFDAYVLEYIDEHYPDEFLLHGYYPWSTMKNVRRDPLSYLYCACLATTFRPEYYTFLSEHGVEPWVGAKVTGSEHLRYCFEHGAKLVTTNYPADALERLEKSGIRNLE